MEGQIITTEGVIKANQQARDSALTHNKALKAQTLSAKAGKIALQGLATAGNMFLMWAISKGIELTVKGIDHLVHAEEYAETAIKAATDSAEKFSKAVKDVQKDTADMEKGVDSIIDRYAELSQGVDPFTNENKKLPLGEYEEFLGLNKQLSELFPSLTRDYDDNGNAILGMSGSVDSVTESIRALVEQEKELAKAKIRENIEQYFNGTDEADGAWKALEGKKQELESVNDELDTLKNTYENLIYSDDAITLGQFHKNFVGREKEEYINYIKNLFGEDIADSVSDAISIHFGKGIWGEFADLTIDFSKLTLTEKQKEGITKSYDTFYSELVAKQKTAQSEFASQNMEFSNNAMFWLQDLSFYKDSGKYMQAAMQNLVQNIDWISYNPEELDYDEVKRIIQDTILTPFQVACDDPVKKAELNKALISLFTMDTSDMPVEDIISQVNSYINTIATIIGEEDTTQLKIGLGFDTSELSQSKDSLLQKLIPSKQEMSAGFGAALIDSINIINADTAQKWVDSLLEDELELANSTAFDKALERQKENLNGAALSAENYNSALEDAKKAQNESDNKNSSSKPAMIDSVNTLSDGFDTIRRVYSDIQDGGTFDFILLDSKNFKETFSGLDAQYNTFIGKVASSPVMK